MKNHQIWLHSTVESMVKDARNHWSVLHYWCIWFIVYATIRVYSIQQIIIQQNNSGERAILTSKISWKLKHRYENMRAQFITILRTPGTPGSLTEDLYLARFITCPSAMFDSSSIGNQNTNTRIVTKIIDYNSIIILFIMNSAWTI